MKSRRLMQIARRGQSLPKGSVVRHSKIGPPMKLWVIRVGGHRSRLLAHVRIAPKADMPYSRRQLFMNEAMAASRVSA